MWNSYIYIYGRKVKDTFIFFDKAIKDLKDDIHEDYWKDTEGNVKRVIISLYELGKLCPYGYWSGD